MKLILDLPQDHFAACSFLRQSLALSLIYEHALFNGPSGNNSASDLTARTDTFALLAIRDPDACTTALREAARIGSTDSVFATQTKQLLVSISAKLLFDGDVDIEVRDATQEVIINFLSQEALKDIKGTTFTDSKQLYLPSGTTTPLYSDKQLMLQGALLNFRTRDDSLRDDRLTKDFKQWVSQVRYALQDSNVSGIMSQYDQHPSDNFPAIRY